MKKIMFIASSLSYGGAEKMLCFVANGFAEYGFDVVILNLLEKEDRQQQLLDSISVRQIQTNKIRYISKILQTVSLIKITANEKPDLIISFKFTPNYLAALAGKVLHIPCIISERADPYREHYNKGRAKLYWQLINSADGGVFQTQMAKACYTKHMNDVGTVIANPVVSPKEKEGIFAIRERNTIVSIGRLDNEQKRYDIMLQAFRLFISEYPEYILKIYGTGNDEELIKKLIEQNELQHNVLLCGYTSDSYHVLMTNEMFVITSDYEGISNSLLEAMAAGIPVISTDSTPGGAAMVIENGVNGLLVPVRNIEAIAKAMKTYAEDEALRLTCGNNGRAVAERFAPDKIINEWIMYANKIMNNYPKENHRIAD